MTLKAIEQKIPAVGSEHFGHPRAGPALPYTALDHTTTAFYRLGERKICHVMLTGQHCLVLVLFKQLLVEMLSVRREDFPFCRMMFKPIEARHGLLLSSY